MSYPTVTGDAVEGVPYREAQSCLGTAFAGSTYQFFLSGTSTPANVYQDGALTTPFPNTGFVVSDNYGRFPPIYLDTSVIYRVQFYDRTNTLRWTVDPYTPLLSTVGTSSLSAYGFQIAPTGEFTLDAPNSGGTGITLALKAGVLGSAPLEVIGTLPGNSAIIVNSSATTGTQTATFAATNKPGPNITNTLLATVAPTGATYTGGTLTANYPGATTSSAVIVLSTGQIISGATFTAGSATFTTPSTSITGTPTTTLLVTGPQASSPAGWLPITCDGVQYYTPIWHDNPFTPYAPNPSAQGESIAGSSVTLNGNGLTTVIGGGAVPSNWFSPTSAGIGASYYINITKLAGPSGVNFSAAQGVWANIGAGGLTITSNAQATIEGSYQLSSSVSGIPVVASGFIELLNNNGVQSPTYNGAANLILAGNGTSSLNGVSSSNWYAPTTASIGAGFYILITQTGGTAGYSFSAATGTPALISSGGITIGISGPGGSTYNVVGVYQISSDSAGATVLGSGSITLTGGSDVQSPNWTGTTPLNLYGNGTTLLSGAGAANWYSPTTSNVGAGYYIDITRTSGTSGVNFSAAQGSWTNITNSGLSIGMTGYTGDVGVITVGGTYKISSSNTGTPVLGSGSISLSVNAGTVLHVYTSAVTNATETIPTNTTNVSCEVWGSGGGGSGSLTASGYGGGAGGRAYSVYTAAALGGAGKTFKYTITNGGAGGVNTSNGTAGTAGIIGVGTVTGFTAMTANGGGAGVIGGPAGSGGTASGGNNTNTTGASGSGSGGGAGTAGKITGDGAPYAGGGAGGFNASGSPGGAGAAVFYYS